MGGDGKGIREDNQENNAKEGLRMWGELTIQIGKESEARKQLTD